MHAIHRPQQNFSDSWVPASDWKTIDETISTLARKKGEIDAEIARWLLAAQRERVDRRCGFGSFSEYVERRLGYDARALKEKLRVASALEQLPRLRAMLETGERSWSAIREISRVATAETEETWIDATERRTVREIETLVSGRKPGELPSDVKDPLITPRRLVFELPAESFALVSQAFEQVRTTIGAGASNVDALLAMAEQILGGGPPDRASYKTSLTICATCERTWMQAGAGVVEVSPANAECAHCDGELVGFTRVDEGVVAATMPDHELTPEIRDNPLERLVSIDPALGARGLLKLASITFGVPLRSMTPQLRRAVRTRDGCRCAVPGCTNFRFIDLHHLKRRSKGGENTPDNILSLCRAHHRALHEGLLSIEGNPSEGYVVRHAGGTLYGAPAIVDPCGSPATRENAASALHRSMKSQTMN